MSNLYAQVSGDHYKSMAFQPIIFIQKNNLNFLEGNIIKYTCRHNSKNKIQDVAKVVHYALLLAEMEYGVTTEELLNMISPPETSNPRPDKGTIDKPYTIWSKEKIDAEQSVAKTEDKECCGSNSCGC